MAFKIVIKLSAELYLLRIGQNRCSLFRTKFEKNLSKVPKNKFREQKLVDYDNGAGVANTLKKLIRSELRYPWPQDVVWEKVVCCNTNQSM